MPNMQQIKAIYEAVLSVLGLNMMAGLVFKYNRFPTKKAPIYRGLLNVLLLVVEFR